MTAAELRTLAPRLCRAYDQLRGALDLAGHQHRVAADQLLSDDRCLAHRQLQLVRAGNTKSAKYNLERHRKLREIEQRCHASRENLAQTRHELKLARDAVRAVDDQLSPTSVREVAA